MNNGWLNGWTQENQKSRNQPLNNQISMKNGIKIRYQNQPFFIRNYFEEDKKSGYVLAKEKLSMIIQN